MTYRLNSTPDQSSYSADGQMLNTSAYNVCKRTHQRIQAKLTREFSYKKWQQRKPGEVNWNDIPQSNSEFIDIKAIDKEMEYRILVSTDAAFDNRCVGSSLALQLKVNSAPSVHSDKTQLSFCKGTPIAGLSATSDEPSAVIEWFDNFDINATPLAKGKSFTPGKTQ